MGTGQTQKVKWIDGMSRYFLYGELEIPMLHGCWLIPLVRAKLGLRHRLELLVGKRNVASLPCIMAASISE